DEPPGAPDAGDEHHLVRGNAKLGHERLDRRQDGIVAAPGTPPNLLVAGEVLLGQGGALTVPVPVRLDGHRYSSLRIASSISWAKNGCPWTFDTETASTRNSARRIFTSWPRFISGTSTRR